MNITTKFNIGDTVYYEVDAEAGNLFPMIVTTITVEVETPDAMIITYHVRSNQKMAGTGFDETELLTLNEAKTAAVANLTTEKNAIQAQIDAINQ